MFFDWNGNGRKDDSFDNFMDLTMMDQMEEDVNKRQQEKDDNNGSGGGCLMMLIGLPLWLPAALIITFLNR